MVLLTYHGRALSFWQYQVHQEQYVQSLICLSNYLTWHSSFQQAVIRNVNEKNAQLQKELGNVVREGTVTR